MLRQEYRKQGCARESGGQYSPERCHQNSCCPRAAGIPRASFPHSLFSFQEDFTFKALKRKRNLALESGSPRLESWLRLAVGSSQSHYKMWIVRSISQPCRERPEWNGPWQQWCLTPGTEWDLSPGNEWSRKYFQSSQTPHDKVRPIQSSEW